MNTLLQWLMPWEPSFIVCLVMGALAGFFIRAKEKLPFHQKFFFWFGLVLLYAAVHTYLDYYAEHQFFIHQLQQMILHHLGPFLIALGLPVRWRSPPVINVFLFSSLTLFWLFPPVHFIAMLDWRFYRLMNWSMIMSGLMFWSAALSPYSPHSPGCRIAMMLAAIPPQIIAGALISMAGHLLYPIYDICGRIFENISPLADQQIGGLIVWIPGAMMCSLGILIVAAREWLTAASLPSAVYDAPSLPPAA